MASTLPSSQWATSRGAQWRDQLDGMEAMLAPVDMPLIEALKFGEAPLRIAEIGCGGGATTRAIAQAAPAGSHVEGFDISPDLVEAAARRADGGLTFTLADAATYRPDRSFDRLTSRFGVMFFADPQAAFANLASWLAPGGRLAFAVWGPGPEVSFMSSIRSAIATVIDVPASEPDAPGPCRYGEGDMLVRLLETAGLSEGHVEAWQGGLKVGGGMGTEEAADFLLASSSTAAPLADAEPAIRDRARDALIATCEAHVKNGAVVMPVRVNIVTALKP